MMDYGDLINIAAVEATWIRKPSKADTKWVKLKGLILKINISDK